MIRPKSHKRILTPEEAALMCSRCKARPRVIGASCKPCHERAAARRATPAYRAAQKRWNMRRDMKREAARVVRRLPIAESHMIAEPGDRNETCTRYPVCLAAMAYEGALDASCPPPCAAYRRAEQAPATAYQSLNGEAHGVPTVRRGRAA